MKQIIAGALTGLIFGAGLGLASMTDPAVVIGFLDFAGAWNPSLAIVMGSAVATTAIGYRLVWRRGRPFWGEKFSLPTATQFDVPLLGGAALFGAGWGLGGYCPGPAVASLSAMHTGTLVFVGAMLAGMIGVKIWRQRPLQAPPVGAH